jgi:hypothetical protein
MPFVSPRTSGSRSRMLIGVVLAALVLIIVIRALGDRGEPETAAVPAAVDASGRGVAVPLDPDEDTLLDAGEEVTTERPAADPLSQRSPAGDPEEPR